MNAEAIFDEIVQLVSAEVSAAGGSLRTSEAQLRHYIAQRADHIARYAPTEPGYHDALRQEALNIASEAANLATDRADEIDARLAGIFQAALALGARALRAA